LVQRKRASGVAATIHLPAPDHREAAKMAYE
jgi:hypothetical protein